MVSARVAPDGMSRWRPQPRVAVTGVALGAAIVSLLPRRVLTAGFYDDLNPCCDWPEFVGVSTMGYAYVNDCASLDPNVYVDRWARDVAKQGTPLRPDTITPNQAKSALKASCQGISGLRRSLCGHENPLHADECAINWCKQSCCALDEFQHDCGPCRAKKRESEIVSVVGCFVNAGSVRIAHQHSDKTFDECKELASDTGYFGLETPQASLTPGQAQCVVLDMYPPLTRLRSVVPCQHESDSDGNMLGGYERLAVYKFEPFKRQCVLPGFIPKVEKKKMLFIFTLGGVQRINLDVCAKMCATRDACLAFAYYRDTSALYANQWPNGHCQMYNAYDPQTLQPTADLSVPYDTYPKYVETTTTTTETQTSSTTTKSTVTRSTVTKTSTTTKSTTTATTATTTTATTTTATTTTATTTTTMTQTSTSATTVTVSTRTTVSSTTTSSTSSRTSVTATSATSTSSSTSISKTSVTTATTETATTTVTKSSTTTSTASTVSSTTTSGTTTSTTTTTTTVEVVCKSDEIEVAPQTPTSARVCRSVSPGNFTEGLLLSASMELTAGQAAVRKVMTRLSTGEYETSVLAATGLLGGVLTVGSPGVGSRKSSAMANTLLAADEFTTILRSPFLVPYDDPIVRMSVQLRDAVTFNVATKPTDFVVEVATVERGLAKPITLRTTCGDGRRPGICSVNVNIHALLAELTERASLRVSCGLGKSPSLRRCGELTYNSLPPDMSSRAVIVDTVYAVLPSRDLLPDATFPVEIRSRFSVFLNTVGVQVKVGPGLKIVGAANSAQSFDQVGFDPPPEASSSVFAALAKRKDAKPAGKQDSATDELLFTLQVQVTANGINTTRASVEISALDGVTDLAERRYNPQAVGQILRSTSVFTDKPVEVKIRADAPAGVFTFADGPSELLNTAAISSTPVKTPIRTIQISREGIQSEVVATCSSPISSVLGTSGRGGCTATLTGEETSHARQIDVAVKLPDDLASIVANAPSVPFRIHFPDLSTLVLRSSPAALRPVASWLNVDACSTLQYQRGAISATVDFTDGETRFEDFDATTILRWQSGDVSIATVDLGTWSIVGHRPGLAAFHATGPGERTLKSLSVPLLEQLPENRLVVVGLDVSLLSVASGLDAISIESGASAAALQRNSRLRVTVRPRAPPPLQYEGDQARVAVSAVFDDGTRHELSAENGLVLRSTSRSLNVSGSIIEVAPDAVEDSGPLVHASWQPNGPCNTSAYPERAEHGVTVSVSPPKALKMQAALAPDRLVCKGGHAAAPGATGHGGPGYPTEGQISVALLFPEGKVLSNLAADRKTSFSVSAGAPFDVDGAGIVTALDCNAVGTTRTGEVTVRYDGQNVTATVKVSVADALSLTVKARPWPQYAGSQSVSVTKLSKVGCTSPPVYQQVVLEALLKLTSGQQTVVSRNVDFTALGDANLTVDQSTRVTSVLPATMPAKVMVLAAFDGMVAEVPLEITVAADPVAIDRLEEVRLVRSGNSGSSLGTLGGRQRASAAHMEAVVVLSDGRKYPTMRDAAGSILLPSVFTFASGVSQSIAMHAVKGSVELLDNHISAVSLTVTPCGAVDKAVTFDVYANMNPTATGDVDLGSIDGAPVKSRKAGDAVLIPARINTGGQSLTYYEIEVDFDPDRLEVVDVTNTIVSPKSGTVRLSWGEADAGDSVKVVGIIPREWGVRGGSEGRELFALKVKAKRAGLVELGGSVLQLLNTAVPSKEISASEAFVAGKVSFEATGRRRERGGGARTPGSSLPQAARPFRARPHRRRRAVPPLTAPSTTYGDTNCDSVFDGRDLVFSLDYYVAKGNNFQTALGKTVVDSLSKCRQKRTLAESDISFLDIDDNSVVELLDLIYLLDIKVGKFYFMDHRITAAAAPSCTFEIAVTVTNADGLPPKAGTKLLIDLAAPAPNAAFDDAIRAADGFVTANKGSGQLHGALVTATRADPSSAKFTFALGGNQVSFTGFGVSLIQVANQKVVSGNQWKFFGGAPRDEVYSSGLRYDAAVLGATSALTLPDGYNPLVRNVSNIVETGCPTLSTTSPTPSRGAVTTPLSTASTATVAPSVPPTSAPSVAPTMSPSPYPTESVAPTAPPTSAPSINNTANERLDAIVLAAARRNLTVSRLQVAAVKAIVDGTGTADGEIVALLVAGNTDGDDSLSGSELRQLLSGPDIFGPVSSAAPQNTTAAATRAPASVTGDGGEPQSTDAGGGGTQPSVTTVVLSRESSTSTAQSTASSTSPSATAAAAESGSGGDDGLGGGLVAILIVCFSVGFFLIGAGAAYRCRQQNRSGSHTFESTAELAQPTSKGLHGNLIQLALQNPAYDQGDGDSLDDLDMFEEATVAETKLTSPEDYTVASASSAEVSFGAVSQALLNARSNPKMLSLELDSVSDVSDADVDEAPGESQRRSEAAPSWMNAIGNPLGVAAVGVSDGVGGAGNADADETGGYLAVDGTEGVDPVGDGSEYLSIDDIAGSGSEYLGADGAKEDGDGYLSMVPDSSLDLDNLDGDAAGGGLNVDDVEC